MPLTALKGPYIPRADGAFRDWLDHFAAVVARQPSAVELMPADADQLLDLAQRYATAYLRSTSPGQRGPIAVGEKNRVRREAWNTVRPIAMRIKRHRGVSNSLKIELGIYPPLNGQSRITAPRTAPTLELLNVGRGFHELRFRDPTRPTRFAKPYGAVSMQLLIAIKKNPSRSPDDAHRSEMKSRHVFIVKFDPKDARKTATYFARWMTRRGHTGPWSMPLSATIA